MPLKAIIALQAFAGLRIGEVLALYAGDVDLEGRMVNVRQTAGRGQITAPKTDRSAASVPMMPALADILAPLIAGRAAA